MIYITPDPKFVIFAQKNNYKILVQIKNSNSIYDNHIIEGIVDSILLGPNCRSSEIKDKGYTPFF